MDIQTYNKVFFITNKIVIFFIDLLILAKLYYKFHYNADIP